MNARDNGIGKRCRCHRIRFPACHDRGQSRLPAFYRLPSGWGRMSRRLSRSITPARAPMTLRRERSRYTAACAMVQSSRCKPRAPRGWSPFRFRAASARKAPETLEAFVKPVPRQTHVHRFQTTTAVWAFVGVDRNESGFAAKQCAPEIPPLKFVRCVVGDRLAADLVHKNRHGDEHSGDHPERRGDQENVARTRSRLGYPMSRDVEGHPPSSLRCLGERQHQLWGSTTFPASPCREPHRPRCVSSPRERPCHSAAYPAPRSRSDPPASGRRR